MFEKEPVPKNNPEAEFHPEKVLAEKILPSVQESMREHFARLESNDPKLLESMQRWADDELPDIVKVAKEEGVSLDEDQDIIDLVTEWIDDSLHETLRTDFSISDENLSAFTSAMNEEAEKWASA